MTTTTTTNIPLDKAYRMVNHGPLVMVSTVSPHGIPNACTVAWSCTFEKMPPRFLLVISSGHKTWKNIMETGDLVINIPTVEYLDAVMYLGNESGNHQDKISLGKVAIRPATVVKAPLLAGCAAWIECRLVDPPHGVPMGGRDKEKRPIMVEAVAASSVEGFMTKNWNVDVMRHPTLHHLGGNMFTHPGPILLAP